MTARNEYHFTATFDNGSEFAIVAHYGIEFQAQIKPDFFTVENVKKILPFRDQDSYEWLTEQLALSINSDKQCEDCGASDQHKEINHYLIGSEDAEALCADCFQYRTGSIQQGAIDHSTYRSSTGL